MPTDPASKPARPTLRERARLGDVAQVTVSLAWRNDPRTTPATRRRVQAVAKRPAISPIRTWPS
ncbi:MAG: LacI family DNA-binding transcriptional regulator [Undibacterium sp.]|nr:LacI family DNA-binding transcriptional regulator [Opitutaceae bacterium]